MSVSRQAGSRAARWDRVKWPMFAHGMREGAQKIVELVNAASAGA